MYPPTESNGAKDTRQEAPKSIIITNESTPLIGQSKIPQQNESLGLLLMLLSAFGFSIMSLLVKIGGARFPSSEIVFARSIIQTLLGLAGCALLSINPLGDPKIRLWLVFRGCVGSIGLALFFYSVTKLSLADATVIFFLGPTFTAILAAVVLGEAFALFDGVCATFCIFGVVLVSKPAFLFGSIHSLTGNANEWERLFAVFCALLGAMMSAIAYVTVRKIGKGAHFMVHVVYFGAISTLISPFGFLFFQDYVTPQGWKEYTMLLCLGIAAFFGQCLLNQGLQLAPAGPGTLMRMNDVAFAFLLGIFVLHDYPDIYSILGSTIIVLMTTALGLHKWHMHSSARRRSA
ncbi:hypothetical protein BDF14DRAFT_1738096 [Spinellus fusiger]|nr:hypothetical protein BDF14DRAFT_1738096 [Spinellus fusiger]